MVGVKRVKKLPRDPRKPQRSLTSYQFFARQNEQAIRDSPYMRRAKQATLQKAAGKMWKNATPGMRRRAEKAANKSKERYLRAMKSYKPPTQEQLEYIRDHWPKRVRNNYIFFVMDNYYDVQLQNPGRSFGSLGRILGKTWRRLPNLRRRLYNHKYMKDRERYYNEVRKLWASLN